MLIEGNSVVLMLIDDDVFIDSNMLMMVTC